MKTASAKSFRVRDAQLLGAVGKDFVFLSSRLSRITVPAGGRAVNAESGRLVFIATSSVSISTVETSGSVDGASARESRLASGKRESRNPFCSTCRGKEQGPASSTWWPSSPCETRIGH